jgi:hypothetical protein
MTLKCLNKYFFKERKCNGILKRWYLKIYAKNIENELKSKSYAQKIHGAFITHESFHFDERRN